MPIRITVYHKGQRIIDSGGNAFRLMRVFNLKFPQVNNVFDIGKGIKVDKHKNPRNYVDTPLDNFFKEKYETFFKENPSNLFSFNYFLPKK